MLTRFARPTISCNRPPVSRQWSILRLRAVLESMHFVDSVMPITDPTGWMKLQRTAPAHQQFAAAFVRFRTVLEEFRPEGQVSDE